MKIVRDRFNVPHITGHTCDDVTWAMGWMLAEDRGLLLAQARYRRGWRPSTRRTSTPSGSSSACASTRRPGRSTGSSSATARGAAAAGRRGRGRPARHRRLPRGPQRPAAADGGTRPLTRVDIYAANAITGQIFGQGGGDEARRSEFLRRCASATAHAAGRRIFDDLSEFDDPDRPRRWRRRSPTGKRTRGQGQRGAGRRAPASRPARGRGRAASAHPRWASNFLLVGGRARRPAIRCSSPARRSATSTRA